MKQRDCIIYDFDGTLYDGDSFIDFFLFSIKNNPSYLFALFLLPLYLFLWKLKIVDDKKLKEQFLLFLKNKSVEKRDELVKGFWENHDNKIFNWVNEELKKDRESEATLFCISASPDFLLKDIVAKLKIENLICSDFRNEKGMLNKMQSPNCKGEEKVLRLNAWEEENKVNLIIKKMVSDSFVDMPLFKLAEKCYFVKNKKVSLLEV